MSTPSDEPTGERPVDAAQAGQPTAFAPAASPTGADSGSGRHRPWGWIVGCVVLLLVAGGFAVWAVSLQSDLDDQKDQTAQAQQEADDANKAVSELSAEVDDIFQSVNDAGDALSQAGQDARDNAQQAIDSIKGNLGTLRERLQQAIKENGEAEATPTPEEPQATATPTEAPATATPEGAQATATPTTAAP